MRKLPVERSRELHPSPNFLVMAEAYIADLSFAYETSWKSRNSTIELVLFLQCGSALVNFRRGKL